MKKLSLYVFLVLMFCNTAHAEDTPYMKLIDSHKGIDKMFVCLPMIQKTADNYKKAMENFIDIYNNLSSSDISKIKFIDLRIPGRAIIKFYSKKE